MSEPLLTVMRWRLSLEQDVTRIQLEVRDALQQRRFSSNQRGFCILIVIR
jgi:hypothetical protein